MTYEEDLGVHWSTCGIDSECCRLRAVLLHQLGREIERVTDPIPILWAELLEPSRAREQHEALCEYYRTNGVTVHMLDTNDTTIPTRVSYHVYDLLKQRSFKIIDLPDGIEYSPELALFFPVVTRLDNRTKNLFPLLRCIPCSIVSEN